MKKSQWKTKIRRACESAKTYQPAFDGPIDTLAQILETRDAAHAQYLESGGKPTVIHVNQAGEANIAKNPAVAIENDLNAQALRYWHELGLTAKSWKSMQRTGDEEAARKPASFEDILAGLSDGD